MSVGQTKLVLYGTDSGLIDKLGRAAEALTYIDCLVGVGPEVTATASLDALLLSPMMGVELLGASPPFLLYQAQVLVTPRVQTERGLPRYGIVGVAIEENDPVGPVEALRLVLTALLRAVREFNANHPDQIRRVGVLPETLGLDGLEPMTGFRMIREVYEREEPISNR